MNRCLSILALAATVLFAAGGARAQVNEVPMKGLGNEWVKQLELDGRMEWEWIETYQDEVYFATRKDFERDGDVVTMWTRIEYRVPQRPGPHQSVASRDAWDCANRRKANVGAIYYGWHNLDDTEPTRTETPLRSWQGIEAGSLGETLLEFACSLGMPDASAPAE